MGNDLVNCEFRFKRWCLLKRDCVHSWNYRGFVVIDIGKLLGFLAGLGIGRSYIYVFTRKSGNLFEAIPISKSIEDSGSAIIATIVFSWIKLMLNLINY